MLSINQLFAHINIFDGNSIVWFFKCLVNGFLGFLGRCVYAIIIVAIGRVADVCQMTFKKLAGIGGGVTLGTNAVQGDIVMAFITSSRVRNIFIALLVLAIVILIMTTFVATIRTEFNKDGNNNKRKVIKNAFRGLANFVLVPVICFFGIIVGNALLRAIDGATNPAGSQTTLSAQIFLAGGYNANRARASQVNNASSGVPYVKDSFGALLTGNRYGSGDGVGNFGVFFDDDPQSLYAHTAADKIDAAFGQNYYLKVGEGFGYITQNLSLSGVSFNSIVGTSYDDAIQNYLNITPETSINSNTLSYSAAMIWWDGMFAGDLKLMVNKSLGKGINNSDFMSNVINSNGIYYFAEGDIIPFSMYNIGLVYYYYNTNIGSFSYLISAICLIYCAFILLVAALGLVKRLFYLTTLFMISSPICATYPLDEGEMLKKWRGEFIKHTLSAYATVIILNLFLIILPLILQLNLFTSTDFILPSIGAGFANYIARILIVIGGLLFFKEGAKTISAIIGAGDALDDGDKKGKEVGKKALIGAGIAATIAKASGKFAGKTTVAAGKGFGKAGVAVGRGVANRNYRKKLDKDIAARNQAENEQLNQNHIEANQNSMNAIAPNSYTSANWGTDNVSNAKDEKNVTSATDNGLATTVNDAESKAENSPQGNSVENSLNNQTSVSDNVSSDIATTNNGLYSGTDKINSIIYGKDGKIDYGASRKNYKNRLKSEKKWDKAKGENDKEKMDYLRSKQQERELNREIAQKLFNGTKKFGKGALNTAGKGFGKLFATVALLGGFDTKKNKESFTAGQKLLERTKRKADDNEKNIKSLKDEVDKIKKDSKKKKK